MTQFTPAAAMSAFVPLKVAIDGSAPFDSSSFITGTSPDCAARMNAVWPVTSTHSSDPSVSRYRRAGGNSLTRALTSTPRSRSVAMTSSAGLAIDAVLVGGRPAAHREIAGIDGGPERRAPPPVGAPQIGVAIEEQLRDGELPVRQRHDERRDAVRIGHVDVGARLDEERRRVHLSVARGKEQRRHAAWRRLLLALRRHAAADDAHAVRAAAGAGRTGGRLLAGARARVHVGAACQQALHDGGVVSSRGPHERGMRSPALTGAPRSSSRSTASTLPARTAAISSVSPEASVVLTSAPASSSRRRIAALPCSAATYTGVTPSPLATVDVRTGAKQRIDCVEVFGAHGPVQRRGSVAGARVDVVSLPQQRADRRHVAGGCGAHERVVGGGGWRREAAAGAWPSR